MEIYDIIMLVVLVGTMLFGAIKGFAWQLASIASIVVSYFVAYRFRGPISESIQADPPWNRFLAMLILFIGTSLVIWVLFRMVSGTIDRFRLREFDRQIGALFGLAKGALYCILITLFSVSLMGDRVRGMIVGSRSGNFISRVLDRSQAVIPPEIHEVVKPYLDQFDRRMSESAGGDSRERTPWFGGSQAQAQSRVSQQPNSIPQSPIPGFRNPGSATAIRGLEVQRSRAGGTQRVQPTSAPLPVEWQRAPRTGTTQQGWNRQR